MLQAEALRKLGERFKPSSAIAAYKENRADAARKKDEKSSKTAEDTKTARSGAARALAAQFIAQVGKKSKKLKKSKKASKVTKKKHKNKVVDEIVSPGSTPDGIEDVPSHDEVAAKPLTRMEKLLLGEDLAPASVVERQKKIEQQKKKTSPLQRQLTGRSKCVFSKNSKKKVFASDEESEIDEKQTEKIPKFYKRMSKKNKKEDRAKTQQAASSSYKGPLKFKSSSSSESSSSSSGESSETDEDGISDAATADSSSDVEIVSSNFSPKNRAAMKKVKAVARKQGMKKKIEEKAAGKPNRRGVKQSALNYDEVKADHVKKIKANMPKKAEHPLAPPYQDIAAIIRVTKVPLAKHRWNKKTYAKYEEEYIRYADFMDSCGLDASPQKCSSWSLQAYTAVLADAAGFEQSRAQYLSNAKMFISAVKPFSSKMKSTYSTCFGLLSKMVAVRSKSEGFRLSHVIKMVLNAANDPEKVAFTGEMKKGNKKAKSSIDLATGAGLLVRGWFGMLRADDLMCTTCTTTAAGRKTKFVVTSSKTDALCHGAEFSLACACDQTSFCPAHEVVPICPVHSITDQRFEYCRKLLGTVVNARAFFKKTIELLGMDIPGRHYSPHSLRIGAVTAAFEGGLELAMVNKFARHKDLQTAVGYTSNAALSPDDVRITWPVVQGATIKELFSEN
eukprot:g5139.t1